MSFPARVPRRWTEEEDRILRAEAERQLSQGRIADWNRIAAKLPDRTNKDCRKRWSKVGENLRKGPWTGAEDQLLVDAVNKFGPRWTLVAKAVGGRHADQCAKRWQYSLDPNLDRSEWTAEDEELLVSAVHLHGRSWSTIRELIFPGRSVTDIKNRHEKLLRERQKAMNTTGSLPNALPQQPGPSAGSTQMEGTMNERWDLGDSSSDDEPMNSEGQGQFLPSLNSPPTLDTTSTIPTPISFDQLDHHLPNVPNPFLEQPTPTFPWMENTLNLDPSWTLEPCSGSAVDQALVMASSSTDTAGAVNIADINTEGPKSEIKEGGGKSTLILEDVHPETVNRIMDTLFKSKAKVKMRLFSQE